MVLVPRCPLAQSVATSFQVGCGLDYGLSLHAIDGLSCDAGCPRFDGGIGSVPSVHVALDWNAPQKWGLELRVGYLASSLSMNTTTATEQVKNSNGDPVPLVRTYTIDVSVPEVVVAVTGTVRFDAILVDIGPALGLSASPTWTSTATIDSPGNVTYGNTRVDTTFFPRQALAGARAAVLRIVAGVRYEVPMGGRLTIAPEARLAVPLTSLRSATPWHESIVSVGMSLLLELGQRGTPLAPGDSQAPGGRGR